MQILCYRKRMILYQKESVYTTKQIFLFWLSELCDRKHNCRLCEQSESFNWKQCDCRPFMMIKYGLKMTQMKNN